MAVSEQPASSTPRAARPVAELFVLQNPAAGPRHPERLRRRIEAELGSRGIHYEFALTRGPGHGADLVSQGLDAGYRRFLVAGGDGTVLEAVSALAGSEAALALLPVGTGNQLAANLGLPRSLRRCVQIALGGGVRKIDLGTIDGRPFTSIAGAGFDAEVVRAEPRVKRRVGYLAYVHAATLAAFSLRPADLRIVVDGEETRARGIGVEVTNMPGLTAPGLRRPLPLVPAGSLDDGLLDGCLLAAETTFGLLAAVGDIITRRFDHSPRLGYFQGRSISVDSDPPLPVQADGERLGTTPFTVSVNPGALNVIVPVAQ